MRMVERGRGEDGGKKRERGEDDGDKKWCV